VRGLETIEMPNQLISVLSDPLLQKLMLLKPDAESSQRVSNWLFACAQDLMSGEGANELEGILEILQAYVSTTKVHGILLYSTRILLTYLYRVCLP
jgi:centromere protein I